jgi:uncharacterized PurR-regulated membrane protein YhhQ (DUF165 family)
MSMNRLLLPGILAMAIIVVASNILVQHLYGKWLTYGAFTYPLGVPCDRPDQPLQGPSAARRKVVVAGFVGADLFADRIADSGRVRPAGDLARCYWLGVGLS